MKGVRKGYMTDIMGKNNNLDNFGKLTEPWDESAPTYNIKKLMEYCKMKKKRPVELTDEERENFRTN